MGLNSRPAEEHAVNTEVVDGAGLDIGRTIRRVLPDFTAARVAADGGPAIDRALWSRLSDLGLIGISLPEDWGGTALGLAEECATVEALAAVVAPVPIVTAFLAARVLGEGSGPRNAELGQALVGGETVIGVALSAEQGIPDSIVADDADGDTAHLSGEIADMLDGAALDTVLVHARNRWWAIDLSAPGVERLEIPTLDMTRRFAKVSFRNAKAVAVGSIGRERIAGLAYLFLAAEGLGVAQTALDLAVAHSLQRQQFGQPIGRFQAIKQKLADCLMATEGARSAVWGAVRGAAGGWPENLGARLAKSQSTAAAVSVAAEAVQVHGAMGCTWDVDLHLLMRRAKHCQLCLDSPERHLQFVAAELIDSSARKDDRNEGEVDLGFTPNPEDEAFIAEFRAWLDENATPERIAKLRSRSGSLAERRAWQAFMADAGWVGVHWPREYGGRDATFTQQMLYHGELASRRIPPLPGNRGLTLVGPTLIAHGNEQQKALLEPTRRADILWSGGFSERGAGSDLASLRTRGVVDGGDLVINGHKIWTSQAQIADWLYALVRTGPLVPKHDGISVVVIPMNSKGLKVQPIRRNAGDFHFNEVFFDDVRIPLANIVGPLNEGWRVNRTTMVGEHLTNFVGSQMSQANTIRRITGFLAKREARFGIDYDLRHRLAQAWATTQVVKFHGLRNVAKFTGGEKPVAEGSIQKLAGQEQERRLFELMIDVQGAAGLQDGLWTWSYLSTRASTIGGGTSEIHRNKLAERVLGMPRDPWADE